MGSPQRLSSSRPAAPIVDFHVGQQCCVLANDRVECLVAVIAIELVSGARRLKGPAGPNEDPILVHGAAPLLTQPEEECLHAALRWSTQ